MEHGLVDTFVTDTTWTTGAEESTKHTMLPSCLAEDTLEGKRPRTHSVSGGKARREVRERVRHGERRVRLYCTVNAANRLVWDV